MSRPKKITLVSKKLEIKIAKAIPLEAGKSYMITMPEIEQADIHTLTEELRKRGINDVIIVNRDAGIAELPPKAD